MIIPILLALGGAALLWKVAQDSARAEPEKKPVDTKTADPTKTETKPPADPGPCPGGVDGEMSETQRSVYMATLTMVSDPVALETAAVAFDAQCHPSAAKALRSKASELKTLGVPDGYKATDDTSTIPGVDTTPKPETPADVPVDTKPGILNISGPLPAPAADGTVKTPKPGYRSRPTDQWWSGPLVKGDTPWELAKWVTGDGRRYTELVTANSPPKKTVGDPARPFETGYSFVSYKINERVRIPQSWNAKIDQTGHHTGTGLDFPIDPDDFTDGTYSA